MFSCVEILVEANANTTKPLQIPMEPPAGSVHPRPNIQSQHVALTVFLSGSSNSVQYLPYIDIIMHPHLHTKNALGKFFEHFIATAR